MGQCCCCCCYLVGRVVSVAVEDDAPMILEGLLSHALGGGALAQQTVEVDIKLVWVRDVRDTRQLS